MIDNFKGENFFLSNFYPTAVEYRGLIFPTSENAYQAAKCKNDDDFIMFVNMTAGESKKAGQKVDLINNWDVRKLGIMREILKSKFADPELIRLLSLTDDQLLVEGNTWGDTYWGVCNGKGENNLGKELMLIRDEINK